MGRLISIASLAVCAAAWLPTLVRADSCMTDGDCSEGFRCDLPPVAGVDCDPSASDCDPEAIAPPIGECEPSPLLCRSDGDCPAGLTCDRHRGEECAVAPAGGAAGAGAGATPPQEPACRIVEHEQGECVFTLTECSTDAQCRAPEQCMALGRMSECSASGAAPACAGDDCPPPPPPSQERCVTTTLSYCFPAIEPCDQGESCRSGTRCVALNEDQLRNPPPGWEGVHALCLTEGWALAVEGRVEAESATSKSAESSRARGAADSAQDSGVPDEDVQPDANEGCAVRAPGARGAASAFGLLALGLAALVLRRRTTER